MRRYARLSIETTRSITPSRTGERPNSMVLTKAYRSERSGLCVGRRTTSSALVAPNPKWPSDWAVGARLTSTPKAGSRARARDERVAHGRLANRLGRVWLKEVSGCRAVVSIIQPPHTYRIGWGGCGPISARVSHGRIRHTTTTRHVLGRVWLKEVPGCHCAVSFTQPQRHTHRIDMSVQPLVRSLPGENLQISKASAPRYFTPIAPKTRQEPLHSEQLFDR